MIKLGKKWAYVDCVACGKKKYMSYAALEKRIERAGSKDELEKTFTCRGCKLKQKKEA